MATVSERAQELSEALLSIAGRDSMTVEQVVTARNSLIEQALLAERRCVWAAAIEAIQNKKALPGLNRVIAISALRAAAEKEVGNG